MSYTKHVWQNGETITADKMNNIEDGINNFAILLTVTQNYGTREILRVGYAKELPNQLEYQFVSDDNDDYFRAVIMSGATTDKFVGPYVGINSNGVFPVIAISAITLVGNYIVLQDGIDITSQFKETHYPGNSATFWAIPATSGIMNLTVTEL